MVERMFVAEEKQSLERLKEEARVAKELQLTPLLPVKTEPEASASSTSYPTEMIHAPLLNGKREPGTDEQPSPTAASKVTPKVKAEKKSNFLKNL